MGEVALAAVAAVPLTAVPLTAVALLGVAAEELEVELELESFVELVLFELFEDFEDPLTV